MPTRHDVVRIRQFLGRRRLCRLPQVADGLVPVTVAKSQRAQRHVRGVNRRAVIRMIPELRRQLQCVFRVSPGLCSCELETASKIRVVPPGDVLHGPVCVLGQMGELFESLQFRQRGDVSVKRSWRYPPQRLPVFQLRSHAEERGVRQNSLRVHLQYSLEARLGPRRRIDAHPWAAAATRQEPPDCRQQHFIGGFAELSSNERCVRRKRFGHAQRSHAVPAGRRLGANEHARVEPSQPCGPRTFRFQRSRPQQHLLRQGFVGHLEKVGSVSKRNSIHVRSSCLREPTRFRLRIPNRIAGKERGKILREDPRLKRTGEVRIRLVIDQPEDVCPPRREKPAVDNFVRNERVVFDSHRGRRRRTVFPPDRGSGFVLHPVAREKPL